MILSEFQEFIFQLFKTNLKILKILTKPSHLYPQLQHIIRFHVRKCISKNIHDTLYMYMLSQVQENILWREHNKS